MGNPNLMTLGGARYNYISGPDGKAYAIGGKVTVSTRPIKDAHDAYRKANALKNAALGVENPSPSDFAAAASAETIKHEALNKFSNNKEQISLASQRYNDSKTLFNKTSTINYYF